MTSLHIILLVSFNSGLFGARKGVGGFWRSLQQEVFDQFDRLLKP